MSALKHDIILFLVCSIAIQKKQGKMSWEEKKIQSCFAGWDHMAKASEHLLWNSGSPS